MIKAKIKNLLYKTLSRIFELGDLPAPHWTKTVSITAGSSLDVVFNFADTADGFDMSGYRLLTLNTITMSGTYSEYIALRGFSISNGNGTFAVKIRSLAASSTITATVQVYGIAIKKLGGVLRNLSIFKAFRHFMSLQKGGGVDGQTGYKGITLQGSRKADQHRYGIHRKLDRVLIFCEPSTSDADTHTAGRNVLIAGAYTADERHEIFSELQCNSSAIQGSDRSRLFPYGGNSHRASRRIPAKLGINISDVFILGKGFNNRYPNCIAFSERRCAA